MLPRSSPAAFLTESPASELADSTRRYRLSGSVCWILPAILNLLSIHNLRLVIAAVNTDAWYENLSGPIPGE
jgi:hypothetical protein